MKVKCLKFNTYYDDQDYITDCINTALDGKEVIDIKLLLLNTLKSMKCLYL